MFKPPDFMSCASNKKLSHVPFNQHFLLLFVFFLIDYCILRLRFLVYVVIYDVYHPFLFVGEFGSLTSTHFFPPIIVSVCCLGQNQHFSHIFQPMLPLRSLKNKRLFFKQLQGPSTLVFNGSFYPLNHLSFYAWLTKEGLFFLLEIFLKYLMGKYDLAANSFEKVCPLTWMKNGKHVPYWFYKLRLGLGV